MKKNDKPVSTKEAAPDRPVDDETAHMARAFGKMCELIRAAYNGSVIGDSANQCIAVTQSWIAERIRERQKELNQNGRK